MIGKGDSKWVVGIIMLSSIIPNDAGRTGGSF